MTREIFVDQRATLVITTLHHRPWCSVVLEVP